jgi:hypothetical protein
MTRSSMKSRRDPGRLARPYRPVMMFVLLVRLIPRDFPSFRSSWRIGLTGRYLASTWSGRRSRVEQVPADRFQLGALQFSCLRLFSKLCTRLARCSGSFLAVRRWIRGGSKNVRQESVGLEGGGHGRPAIRAGPRGGAG